MTNNNIFNIGEFVEVVDCKMMGADDYTGRKGKIIGQSLDRDLNVVYEVLLENAPCGLYFLPTELKDANYPFNTGDLVEVVDCKMMGADDFIGSKGRVIGKSIDRDKRNVYEVKLDNMPHGLYFLAVELKKL